ncbi:hypothetical protein OVA07_03395 [Novosphingobium sp. SL115]|uniref:hypothetical protein n=1 Tax=Novosphingobium sp. SL115 TaxID=2995150 RepID=UPI002272753C|nr:hypothetical protein [Novosphingobium sp. SL115]MCY1670052.1 hypothetical protein [Novosphingobium sp. SL115]
MSARSDQLEGTQAVCILNGVGAQSWLSASERPTGPLAFTEHRNRLIGPIFSFSVKGNI